MRTSILAAGILALASGCSPFTYEEAETVARANTLAGVAAWSALSSELAAQGRRGTESELTWSEIDGGWDFEGWIESDGPQWTGRIDFDGSLVGDEGSADWDFGADLDQVDDGAVVLDGSMDWAWGAEVTDDTAHIEWTVLGEITATGEANGTGEMDYTATLDVTPGTASYVVDGTVGGTPVDFSLTINVPSR